MTADTQSSARRMGAEFAFNAPYAPPTRRSQPPSWLDEPQESERRIDAYARRVIEGIRANAGGLGGIEDFLHAYSLSTREGSPSWCWRKRCCGCPTPPPPTG